MSKVTEELDFMWRERVLDYYNELKRLAAYNDHNASEMEGMRSMLEIQGLTVKGIEG